MFENSHIPTDRSGNFQSVILTAGIKQDHIVDPQQALQAFLDVRDLVLGQNDGGDRDAIRGVH